jgi:t-SNARE complex subunit (syntaxin)
MIVKNHETRAWRSWKITCYTVMVIALLVTVAHLVLGA